MESSQQNFVLGSPRATFPEKKRGPAGTKVGRSYLSSMTKVENVLRDFSVHFIKARSNWNSCNGGPLAIL